MVNGMNRQNRTERREETLPAVQVRYLEDVDVLQVRAGEIDGEWETLGQGLVAYHDSEGTLTGFWIDGASHIMQPFVDALNRQHKSGCECEVADVDAGEQPKTTGTLGVTPT